MWITEMFDDVKHNDHVEMQHWQFVYLVSQEQAGTVALFGNLASIVGDLHPKTFPVSGFGNRQMGAVAASNVKQVTARTFGLIFRQQLSKERKQPLSLLVIIVVTTAWQAFKVGSLVVYLVKRPLFGHRPYKIRSALKAAE